MKILYVTRHFNHSGYLVLERLIQDNFNITGVLLHDNSDKLRNRYYRFFYRLKYYVESKYFGFERLKNLNSEEELARKHNLNRLYTKSIKSVSFYQELIRTNPDIIVLGGGWHELIPKRVFSYPKYGCINTHPSLLPEFRGTSITRWQVLHGIKKSGSTIHYVDDRFDTGGMLAQKELCLSNEHQISPQQLFYHLGKLGADIMSIVLKKIESEKKILSTQVVHHNEKFYKYFKKWQWDETKLIVNWNNDLRSIHYFILSCSQEHYKYLGPIIFIEKKKYFLRKTKLIKNEIVESESNALICVKLRNGNVGITSKVSDYTLELIQIQPFNVRQDRINKAFNPNKILLKKINKPFLNE